MSLGKIVGIVQARMKSSRLPGKVLLEIDGDPMLQWVLKRLEQSQAIDQIIIATTTDPSDDAVEVFCRSQGYGCYRGDMYDVLDRFYHAATWVEADIVVRVTADCPIIDPALVDETILAFLGQDAAPGPFDFAANRLPPPFTRTYPIGLDTEVCSYSALRRAWLEADRPFHREHVMPYFYEGIGTPERIKKNQHPGDLDCYVSPRGFRLVVLNDIEDHSSYRWTVDTPADLVLINQIVKRFKGSLDFNWRDVLNIYLDEPNLKTLNTGVYHKDFHESEQTS